MFESGFPFKTWMIGAAIILGLVFTFHESTRRKVVALIPSRVADALPDRVTSMFESPSEGEKLPPDVVMGLSDDHELWYSLKDLNGQPMASSDFKGKVIVLLVWNSDCGGQCLETMRHMQKLARTYADKDVMAVTINNDMLTKGMTDAEVKQYVAENGIQLPVMLMDLPTGQNFWPTECRNGLAKQPFHELLVYDRNGAVRFRANQDYTARAVQEVLAGWEN